MDWGFVLQLVTVIGGWISIYLNTQVRIVKIEEKYNNLQTMMTFHEGDVKDLKSVIKENTQAINDLKVELSKLNNK